MLKHLAAVSVIALCCTAAALADTNNHAAANAPAANAAQANLAPVDTMTCDQMQAEMTADGQVMSHQLDPQFGVDAQAQYNEAMQKEREINQQAPANALACMIALCRGRTTSAATAGASGRGAKSSACADANEPAQFVHERARSGAHAGDQ